MAGENQPKHSDHVCQLAIRLFGQNCLFFSNQQMCRSRISNVATHFKKRKPTQTVPRDLPMESRRPKPLFFFFLFPSSSSATTERKRSLSDAFLGAAPNATGLQLYFSSSSMPERKTRPAGKQATLFYSFLVLFFFLNVYPFFLK